MNSIVSMCGYLNYLHNNFIIKKNKRFRKVFKSISTIDLECLYLLISDELECRK